MWAILIGWLVFSPPVIPYHTAARRLAIKTHYVHDVVVRGRKMTQTTSKRPKPKHEIQANGRKAKRCAQLSTILTCPCGVLT